VLLNRFPLGFSSALVFVACSFPYRFDPTLSRSHIKLAQVMVEVLVHSSAPLVWREQTEKGMRMLCALRFPALMKLPDTNFELVLFTAEISLIGYDQALVGGAAPGKWLIVAEDRLHHRSDDPTDQDARPYETSGGEVERGGAMRHHLRNLHFAPLPVRRRLKLVNPRDQFVDSVWLEEIFHGRGLRR